jgi:hypothetical protein
MNLYLRFSLIVWIALLPALMVSGQLKFTTVVNSQDVGQRDYLQVQYTVENAQQIEEFDPPADFPGFHIIQGPNQTNGMSVINGNRSEYRGLSFLLQPTHTGKFTIAGATAVINGKKMQSGNIVVTVHAGGSGNVPSNGSPFAGFPGMQGFGPDPFAPRSDPEPDREDVIKPGENVTEKIRKNLILKVQTDRSSCYVGEPIVATYKLYSRLDAESRVTRRPSLNGFSVYDMVDPGVDSRSVEKLNGKQFMVHTIRKAQLIPLQAGSVDLDPAEVENTVHFVLSGGRRGESHRSGNRLQDMLDQLADESNMGPVVDEKVTLDTKPLTITVKPLPEANKPAGFNGAVGNFSIEASLANRNVAAQDEATLHVVVKGKGNLPVMTAPVVDWPKGIDAYDPRAKEQVDKTVVPMSGSKSFDYVFTARDSGHYTIPVINISFFDPVSQVYRSASSEPIEFQVWPAAKKPRPAQKAPVAETGEEPGGVLPYVLGFALAILIGCGVLLAWRRRGRKGEMEEGAKGLGEAERMPEKMAAKAGEKSMEKTARRSRGNSPERPSETSPERFPERTPETRTPVPTSAYVPMAPAPDPLAEARQYFENADFKAFYREINRAIWKSIGRKLDLPSSELNKHNVVTQLELRGWDAPSVLSLENVLNACELNLYTPAYDTYNMQQLLRQAEWVLDRLG